MGERFVQLAPLRGDGHHHGPFNHRPMNDIARTLYVGNLRFDTEEVVVRRWFEVYGDVLSVKLIRDQNTKRSKGFGFVTFASERDARDALNDAAGRELDGAAIKVNVTYRGDPPPGAGGPGRMRGRPGFFPGRGGPFRPPPGPGPGPGIDRRVSEPAPDRYSPGRFSPGRYSPRSHSLSPDRRGRKRGRHASLSKSRSRSRSGTRSPTASRSPRGRSPSSSPSPSRSRTRSPSRQRYSASPAPASGTPRRGAADGSASGGAAAASPPPASSDAQQQPSVPSSAAPLPPPPSVASPPAAPVTEDVAPPEGGAAGVDQPPPVAARGRAPIPASVPAAPAGGGAAPAVAPGAKPPPSAEAVKKELLRLRKREQELGGSVRSLQDELARRERQLAQRDRDLAEAQLQLRSLQPQVDRYRQWVADLLDGTAKLAASRGAVAAAEAEARRREGALAALQRDILADAERSGLELPKLGDQGLQEYDDAAWEQLAATIQESERAAEEAAAGEAGDERDAAQARDPTPDGQLQVVMQEAAMDEDP